MDQLEKDKAELKKLRQELDWKQDEVNRMENAIEFGRCKQCETPLMPGDFEYCGDYPECEAPMTDDQRVKAFGNAISNMTPEDIEKYFPEADPIPNGWVSIEEHLPAVTIDDFLKHNAIVRMIKVKDKDGNEFESQVGDHQMWYYIAKEAGITHWWND